MERREFEVELKFDGAEAGEGSFSGLASTFGEVDLGGDTIARGAFAESLKEWRRRKSLPPMLWMHDPTTIIGKWTAVKESDTGLEVQGELIRDLPKGAEAYALLKHGALRGMSIGYRIPKGGAAEPRKNSQARRLLKQIDLMEISLVSIPMNPSAQVQSVKAMTDEDFADLKHEIEAVLTKRGAGLLSRSEARTLLGGGWDALKAMRGAGDAGDNAADHFRRLIETLRR